VQKLAQVDIGQTFNTNIGRTVGLGQLVSIIISNAIVLAGIIMVFLLVVGGIGIISGAGQDSPDKAARGKQTVTFALIGFIIIFAAYWIVQIIETITGVNIFNPGF